MWTIPDDARGRARVVAKQAGVVAGTGFADCVFGAADASLERAWLLSDGSDVARGDLIATVHGALRPIVTAERTALNALARLSGIATSTRGYVAAVDGTGARIVDTRKTTPGWRALEKAAVLAGGGTNHRMGLYDMVLIKENHARAAGGIAAAIRAVRSPALAQGVEVEVEVTNLEELEEALGEGAARILLDNMALEDLRAAAERVAGLDPRPVLEASGGVSLASVRAVAETGVDLISVGALTHSAPALDLTLLVDP
jgi:nicotinate-nucleotide pyrophosphorylase (carboxylating)